MTSEASRIVDNSTISEPNPTPPTPNEPQYSEEAVARSVPEDWVTYYRIRVELKQDGGAKKFRPVQSMREIVDAVTGVGKTAIVKLDNNAENNEPLLQIPKGMKEEGEFKEYFTVQIQENRAFRKINVIFNVCSEIEFPDLKHKLGEYLNARNIVMHEHVFEGTKVHHCGYLTGLNPSKIDTKTVSEYVSYRTGIYNIQVVLGQVFYKGEDKKWTKTDLLAVLTEPKEAAVVSKRLIEDQLFPSKGVEYIDCRAIVYHRDFKNDIPEVVDEHKEKLRNQTTIIVEDALGDDELLGDIMDLEDVTFVNKSKANKDSFIVITTKEKRGKTEKEIVDIIKKPAYSRRSEEGRPYLRYNDPDITNRKVPQEKEKKIVIEIPEEFDEIELEYMKKIKEKAQARRNKRASKQSDGVNLTKEKMDSDNTKENDKDDTSSQEERAALEEKLANKIRKKRRQRSKKRLPQNTAEDQNKTDQDQSDDAMECEEQGNAQNVTSTPQLQRHVKDSWEDEDHENEPGILSPYKTPMKNLLGRIEEEIEPKTTETAKGSEKDGPEDTSGVDANHDDSDTETVKTTNLTRNSKRGASKSPDKHDYANWTPAKRFVPRKNKQVRVMSPYRLLMDASSLPRKHLGRGGGGPGNLSSATSKNSRTMAGSFGRGGGI